MPLIKPKAKEKILAAVREAEEARAAGPMLRTYFAISLNRNSFSAGRNNGFSRFQGNATKVANYPEAQSEYLKLRRGEMETDFIKWDERGLIPAIVQDYKTREVLMLAYMNEESLKLSQETGETHFWSRSRQELWHKGETSGNTQRIVEIRYDCDADALLVLVEPRGPACHTGNYSCFYRTLYPGGHGITEEAGN